MGYAARMTLDEKISSLFQPDTLAEHEYASTLHRNDRLGPEEQLMLAVLEDAVFCFQKYLFARDKKGRAFFQEAEEWIMEKGGNWFFSSTNICNVLEISPHYLRQGLLRWKKTQLENRAEKLKKDNVAKRKPIVRKGAKPLKVKRSPHAIF